MWRSTIGRHAPLREREAMKGKLMNVGRGGALTALGLLVAMGCGGSDAAQVPPNDGGGGVIVLPDGGTVENPTAPPPPPDGKPVSGVFVSASKGRDDADASKSRPVKTLAAAMLIASQSRLPVIACAETYNESLTLLDGVTMYGYFDCSTPEWGPSGSYARIESPTVPAVLAQGLTLNARFEGFELVAPDVPSVPAAGAPAASSYGMIVRNTQNLEIANVIIRAGRGQDGLDGVEPSENNVEVLTPVSRREGQDSRLQSACTPDFVLGRKCDDTTVAGGTGGMSQCKFGASGGPGGTGGKAPIGDYGSWRAPVFSADARGLPTSATSTSPTAKGGVGSLTQVGYEDGDPGATGLAGPNGNHGSWSFDEAGFVPGDGTPGGVGLPGQGGGGGAGTSWLWVDATTKYEFPPEGIRYGAAGAGGGAGGCGGLPGTAGRGGGASVGMFVVASRIRLINSRIEGKQGGRAGRGALGFTGTPGNEGGLGRRPGGLYGAAGGRGGDGGPAGLSGHGAPGASIALVVKAGSSVHTEKVVLHPGIGGEGYPQTVRGTQSLPAVVGIAKTEHGF